MRSLSLLLSLLAGCAITPNDVMREGERSEYRSTRAPQEVARCIQRNASEIRLGILGLGSQPAYIRDHTIPGSLEVLYGGGVTIAVAVVRPAASGSTFTIWRNPQPVSGEGTLEQQMARGC
ncbi:MAG: hypothetical protein HYY28_11410 [Betaproteobacteria bacterium]|nr:hypothetical protein [Betaproteobacteria bacterium]